jgi:hypothetical protein
MLDISSTDVHYVSDGVGNRTAVIIPIQVWSAIERELSSEKETAYLSESAAMKQRILESRQQTETISFEETWDTGDTRENSRTYSQSFEEFHGHQMVVRLNFPAYCEITEHDEGVDISYLPLNTHGCGSTLEESVADIAHELQYLYQHSKKQVDSNLTDYAKKIKYGTLLLVKEITHGQS